MSRVSEGRIDANRVRVGYEHDYSLCTDDDILSQYNYKLYPGGITYVIEMRASFIVKTKDGENQIVGSERYKTDITTKDHMIPFMMHLLLSFRLEEYWMTREEAYALEFKVRDFAKQTLLDPKYANRDVVPIVINIDVCAVQQDDETIGGAHDRAVRVEDLVPVDTFDRGRWVVLCFSLLKRYRVEDVEKADVCSICCKDPRIGAQMSVMHCCNHAFHSNCLFRWVSDKNMCPCCNSVLELDPDLFEEDF